MQVSKVEVPTAVVFMDVIQSLCFDRHSTVKMFCSGSIIEYEQHHSFYICWWPINNNKMRSSTNLVFVTLSVLIIYSSGLCLCSRGGIAVFKDEGGQGNGRHPSECKTSCPQVKRPVCGTDGRTYLNYCFLKQRMCETNSVRFDHLGDCGKFKCNEPCVPLLDFVCGTDGKTYGSECYLNQAMICDGVDVLLAHEGKCKCNPSCPHVYTPVCGSDAKTYDNMCLLRYQRCIGNKIGVVSYRECDESMFRPKSNGPVRVE